MLFSVASEKIMILHGGIFFDRHKSDFIMQKRTIKYIILRVKNCVFLMNFYEKKTVFWKNRKATARRNFIVRLYNFIRKCWKPAPKKSKYFSEKFEKYLKPP